jgi:hypothetical protein
MELRKPDGLRRSAHCRYRKITFQDELRLLLTRHEIEFNERYAETNEFLSTD